MTRILLIICILCVWQGSAFGQPAGADDAATLYLQATKVVDANAAADPRIWSPAASDLPYEAYPPYSAEWNRLESADFPANAAARDLSHQARSLDHAAWHAKGLPQDAYYLKESRALSNELADAAMYQHLNKDDAAAFETLRDQWHLGDVLENHSDKWVLALLISAAVRAQTLERLEIITSGAAFTTAPGDKKSVQISVASELIGQLLKCPDAKAEVGDFIRGDGVSAGMKKESMDRLVNTINRLNAERGMTAISIACHLYRFNTGRWPNSTEDLKKYLTALPVDPYGDAKETLGYVLIKGGLPDGSDRPLVYSRDGVEDGLFFQTNQPAYSYYKGDGSNRPDAEQKHGGQFRDVAGWAPKAGKKAEPTTRPLE